MPKRPLKEGAAGHGRIRYIDIREGVVAAECRVLDSDGKVRTVRAQGGTNDDAETNLLRKLNERTGPPAQKKRTLFGPHGEPLPEGLDVEGKILPTTTIREATMFWLTEVSNDKSLKQQSRGYWRRVARHTVLKQPTPGMTEAQRRVGEAAQNLSAKPVTLTVRDVGTFIKRLASDTPGQARKARQLLALVLDEALDDEAIKFNPARVGKLPKSVAKARKAAKSQLKALSPDQHYEFLDAYRAWRGVSDGKDGAPRDPSHLIEDVIHVLAGTGLRINELLGLRLEDIDLDSNEPSILPSGTVVRLNGLPLRYQVGTKSRDEGEEPRPADRLTLPEDAVTALRRQIQINGHHTYVFVTGSGNLVNASNIHRAFRAIRPLHLAFVTPHTYRRSVATWLRDAGSAALATAQLRHDDSRSTDDYLKDVIGAATNNAALLNKVLKRGDDVG